MLCIDKEQLKSERERYLEYSLPWNTSWRPTDNSVYYRHQVGGNLLLDNKEKEAYMNGNVDYLLSVDKPVAALLADRRQFKIVFHHNDMIEATVNPTETGKLLRVTFYDSNMGNALEVAGWAMTWDPKKERSYEVFETGFRRPSSETESVFE